MRASSLLFACLLAGCLRGPTEVSPNQEFELAPGESVRVTGTDRVVLFEGVAQDSRCPVDATCVWAGNAVVRLRVRSADADSVLELNTTLEPRSGAAGGLRLELRALQPEPRTGQPLPARRYRARLFVRGT